MFDSKYLLPPLGRTSSLSPSEALSCSLYEVGTWWFELIRCDTFDISRLLILPEPRWSVVNEGADRRAESLPPLGPQTPASFWSRAPARSMFCSARTATAWCFNLILDLLFSLTLFKDTHRHFERWASFWLFSHDHSKISVSKRNKILEKKMVYTLPGKKKKTMLYWHLSINTALCVELSSVPRIMHDSIGCTQGYNSGDDAFYHCPPDLKIAV